MAGSGIILFAVGAILLIAVLYVLNLAAKALQIYINKNKK
jgi:hypothetical protein